MKKLIFPIVMLLSLAFAGNTNAQDVPKDPNAPVITFQVDTINYGTIPHNADGYRSFKFTNTGKEPLMISDAHGSCGCTIPTAPKEPIQPGQTAEIKVHYATDRIGQFFKVPDAKAAIKIALDKWTLIYGAKQIESEKPYKAELEGGSVWFVHGTLQEGWNGGTTEMRIRKSDGKILSITHGQ